MKIIIKAAIASWITYALTGCATTDTTIKHAQSKYVGQNMDMLVMDVGAPKSKYVMSNGDIMYKWIYSGSIFMPATTIYNSSATAYGYGNTANAYGSGTATTFGGGPSERVCDMTALTDKNNIIKRIKIDRDTFGTQPGAVSMCAQMFRIN